MLIGILAVHKIYEKYHKQLLELNIKTIKIDKIADLKQIEGLIIQSNNFSYLKNKLNQINLNKNNIHEILYNKPIFAVDKALFFMARINNKLTFDLMDIKINYSDTPGKFKKKLQVPALGEDLYEAYFLNPLYIKEVAPNVGILSHLANNKLIFVRQGNYLAASFLPELSNDLRVLEYYIKMVQDAKNNKL